MPRVGTWIARLAVLAVLCLAPGKSLAQPSGQVLDAFQGVGVEEHLGEPVPLDVRFRDEHNQDVSLGDYFSDGKPVLLNLVYHNCPMLCNLILDGLTATLKEMDWAPGNQFEIVTVSFSPIEGPDVAARQKQRYIDLLGKPEAAAGWHFLTGTEASIQRLARSVGFQFKWVEAQQEYAHPAVLVFVSGEGIISRYLYGLEYPPRSVRSALVEASEGKVGNPVDQLILYCFPYDPDANSYVPHAMNIMKVGGVLTLVLVGGFLLVFWRREGRSVREATEMNA